MATTTKTAEYELVMMLDPETPDERRDEIAANARRRIEASGNLKAENAWGMRKLAYEIRQRTEADYRFFRFETASPLLDELDHNLKITDGVLRFRIFKVDPDAPVIEPPPPVALASASSGRGPGGPRRGPGGPGGRPPRGAPRDEAAREQPGAAREGAAPEEPEAAGAAEPQAPAEPEAPPAAEPEAPASAPEGEQAAE